MEYPQLVVLLVLRLDDAVLPNSNWVLKAVASGRSGMTVRFKTEGLPVGPKVVQQISDVVDVHGGDA